MNTIIGTNSAGVRHAANKFSAVAYPSTYLYRMWSFTMVMGPYQLEMRMHELELLSKYILYYRREKSAIGVVQFSKGVSIRQLEQLMPEFVFQRLTSDEMLTRIGWIHRNKSEHVEMGNFTQRQIVRPNHSDPVREYLYFYNPETGNVAKIDKQTGIAKPARVGDKGPYQMRSWDPELRKFIENRDIDSVTETKTETK